MIHDLIALGVTLEESFDGLNDEDYRINPEQWTKMLDAVSFFNDYVKEKEGKLEPCRLQPKMQHGGITAYSRCFDVTASDVQQFAKAISCASAITIDTMLSGEVCISLTIPNVFVRKDAR